LKRFWPRREDEFAREVRANGPELRGEFVRSLTKRVEASGRRTRLYAASRLAFASAITVLALGTLASFGGLGYAASGTRTAVTAVKRVVAPAKPTRVNRSAAQDQYQPQKVTICHKGHTITIAQAALPAHLAHGDTVGACGVAGASATKGRGGAVLGTTTQSLPFTGISLAATMLLALLFVVAGLILRRSAYRRP